MKKFAITLALKAGKYLLKEFKRNSLPSVKLKGKHNLVTTIDVASERLILGEIEKRYPRHQILSEEIGQVGPKSDYLWLVDPLDGTANFSIKNPLFSVLIALAHKGKLVLGVIYLPCLKELYVAEKGRGAYLNGKRIRVSERTSLEDSVLLYCPRARNLREQKILLGIISSFKNKVRTLREIGSAGIEIGWSACGRTEGIVSAFATPWDVGAGALILREAGGRVTNWQGQDWQIDDQNFVATNKAIHPKILKIIKNIKWS